MKVMTDVYTRFDVYRVYSVSGAFPELRPAATHQDFETFHCCLHVA